jgi:biofilm PGA synthesis N-glycosyltransferase PgaC
MYTEDIDISWNLQTRFWDVRYEERALCWILTPETLAGLWKQRVRWAQGGAEVLLKYFRRFWDYRQRRFWPVCIEYAISVVWSYLFFFCCAVALLNAVAWAGWIPPLPAPWSMVTIVPPEWTGTLLACVCMLQALAALLFERQAERGMPRYLFWFIWYPVAFWLLSATATAWGLPKALFRARGRRAVWTSPDRGLQ